MPDPPRPIADALSKPIVIPDLEDGLTVAVEATEADLGASISADVDVGKPGGWSVGAQGGWWQSTGAIVKGWLQWRPQKK